MTFRRKVEQKTRKHKITNTLFREKLETKATEKDKVKCLNNTRRWKTNK